MKEIRLGKGGLVTLVDNEDYDYLMQWKWYVDTIGNVQYVKRNDKASGKKIYLHREVMNPPKDRVIDHIDHNGLNNQKSNLRICTISQNARNNIKSPKSKYRGVRINDEGYIVAYARIDKTTRYLGVFKTEMDAAIARDKFVYENFGEYAQLNFPDLLNTDVQRISKIVNQRNKEWLNKFELELSVFNKLLQK